jgi:LytS/YehU family sensor histidine kinase
MLLQPVVENAIKFGLYDTTETINISITAKNANDQLIINVKNPFDAATSLPQKGTGFGLNSVKRRLYLLFARTDLLETTTEDHLFITSIRVPQQ